MIQNMNSSLQFGRKRNRNIVRKAASKIYYEMRSCASFFIPTCVVLLYHRVTREKLVGMPNLGVSPDVFESQIAFLKKNYPILPLQNAVELSKNGKLPRRSIVITFDDGYVDSFEEVLPIIKRHEVPMTLFVTAGKVDQMNEFWWDDLERIFLLGKELPEVLEMDLEGELKKWNMSDDSPSIVYEELMTQLKSRSERVIREKIRELCEWAGLEEMGRKSHRVVTKEELVQLSQCPYIEIGAHTVNHLSLSSQSNGDQEYEIKHSKKLLEEMLGEKIQSFAYPYGYPEEHFNGIAAQISKDAGFNVAVTTLPLSMRNYLKDTYRIPRYPVYEWTESELKENLKQYFKRSGFWQKIKFADLY